MQDYQLTVIIERDEDGRFLAICPALQGCYTEGESEAEARHLIADAIRLHIESRLERGEGFRPKSRLRKSPYRCDSEASAAHRSRADCNPSSPRIRTRSAIRKSRNLNSREWKTRDCAVHSGGTIGKGLLRSIMNDAGLTRDDLKA